MKRIIEKRNNEAAVLLHLSTQNTWPQLFVCVSILYLFCITHCSQIGPVRFSSNKGVRKTLTPGEVISEVFCQTLLLLGLRKMVSIPCSPTWKKL
jgi:hypothetical protein